MTTIGELGSLLTCIDNAVKTVFNDDAYVTYLAPSAKYKEDGTLLEIVISVFQDRYDYESYKTRREIFDNIIYNPVFHSSHILNKVSIGWCELG